MPHIVPFDMEDTIYSGESVQLQCHVSKGDLPLQINWNFHGLELSSHLGISTMKAGERTSLLSISSVTSRHSGTYSCTASNKAGSTSYSATVHVNGREVIGNGVFKKLNPSYVILHLHASYNIVFLTYICVLYLTDVLFYFIATAFKTTVAPYIVPFEADGSVFAGESVQLTCHVSKGDSPINISWNFHGRDMSSHLGMSTTKMGERTSFLTISSVTATHSGNYTCIAKNKAGQISYTTSLNVNGIYYI